MLDVARWRPGGDRVTWVEGDARSLRLGRRYDLIILTGHAFQVFLTAEDQFAALSTVAAHLTTMGRFIFDSRNPAARTWERKSGGKAPRLLEDPELGRIEVRNEPSYDEDTGILSSLDHYRVMRTGEVLTASISIRFTPQEDLATMLRSAGLVVEKWLGDWEGNTYHPASADIIPLGRLAEG
jgi:hypothetical protein